MSAIAISRGPGPADPVNARRGVGFTSREPWCVEVAAGAGEVSADLPVELSVESSRAIGPTDELAYVVHPESAATDQHRWDSTHVALDAELDDGTRLSELATDQYADRLTPQAQGEAKKLWVDQWNLRRVDLSRMAGRRITRVLVTVRATDRPLRIFLDDVAIRPRPAVPATPLDRVITTRGTHSSDRFSRGNNAPLVGLPHGGVFGLPMTDADRGNWPYHFQARSLQAFATSHLPSPWMGDRGVFQVMPSPLAAPDCDRAARALDFDRADEVARAHRYAVRFADGVDAELVPGGFALSLRLTGARSLILDHHGAVRSASVSTEGEETVVRALLDDREGMPSHHVHVRLPHALADHTSFDGERLRGYLVLGPSRHGPTDVRLGISTVSHEQAAANLAAAGDHDTMAARARQTWERCLGTVRIEGASEDQMISLYSGLYRLFLYPNRYGEGPDHAHLSPYDLTTVRHAPMTTTHGFWDTYRTAWPLLALLDPTAAGELAEGFVEHLRDRGWTPRWSAPGAEDCMTGTSLDIVLGDLALREVPGIDWDTAYASVVKNATVPSDDARVGRKGLRRGIFRGYIDTDTHEGLSWTLDNAINDWGAARLAGVMRARVQGDAERLAAEETYFSRRALSYRRVFDTDRGFFIGRTPTGEWREGVDPDVWGHDYTETNAWGTAFTAPHDGAGVAELHGGEAALGAKLDEFFARAETGDAELSGHYGFAIHEMTEARDVRMGMLGLSNQPAHHIPFMYLFAGRHDDAHRIVRECLSRLFVGSDFGQGYPGDEDNGEMSAWYFFATIGLYPLVPGSASYVLLPPAVRRTELRPVGGEPIVIEARGEGDYIAAVSVDGEPWEEISIPHARLVAGAHLIITRASTPTGWAAASRPCSASDAGLAGPLVDVAAPGNPLTDDTGEHEVALLAGEGITIDLTGPAEIGLYTVTSAVSGSLSWRVDYRDRTGTTVATEQRAAEPFTWAGQTRPFRVRRGESVAACSVRFTALTECRLTQLEFIHA